MLQGESIERNSSSPCVMKVFWRWQATRWDEVGDLARQHVTRWCSQSTPRVASSLPFLFLSCRNGFLSLRLFYFEPSTYRLQTPTRVIWHICIYLWRPSVSPTLHRLWSMWLEPDEQPRRDSTANSCNIEGWITNLMPYIMTCQPEQTLFCGKERLRKPRDNMDWWFMEILELQEFKFEKL